jgi:chromosome segregation ATPase
MSSGERVFCVKSLPCEKVVVFKDRAEVKRLLKTKLTRGENELIVKSMSNLIDKDSVRVEGHGNATVLDVVCENKRVELSNSTVASEKIKEAKSELKSLESRQKVNKYKLEKLTKQISVLNDYASSLSKPSATNSDALPNVENFFAFIDSYSDKFEALSSAKHTLENEVEQLDESISVAKDNLSRVSSSNLDLNETM